MTTWIVVDDTHNRDTAPGWIGVTFTDFDLIPLSVHVQELEAPLPARAALERARAAWARTHDQLSMEI